VDIEQQRQDGILESLDARAGILFGTAAVIATLAASQGLGGLPGALLAAVSAVLATTIFLPKPLSVMDTKAFAMSYALKDPADADREALRRRLANLEANDDARHVGVRRLKQAVFTLIAAIIVTAIGLAVQDTFHSSKGGAGIDQPQSTATAG
jgi:hypothetical protein